jgi:hypothetical protein
MSERAPAPDAKIYKLAREFDLWLWLCDSCLAARKKLNWQVRETKPAPHPLTCDDCPVPF